MATFLALTLLPFAFFATLCLLLIARSELNEKDLEIKKLKQDRIDTMRAHAEHEQILLRNLRHSRENADQYKRDLISANRWIQKLEKQNFQRVVDLFPKS